MIKKFLMAQGLLLLLVGSPTTVNAQECGDSVCVPAENASTCPFECIELLFAETGTSFTGVVVSLSSTEIVSVSLKDANAEYVDFAIVGTAASTILTLEGLFPNTSYFIYQDDFRTFQQIETDGAGAFSFVQDLSEYHQVFIRNQPSTIFISDDPTGGDCGLVGIWDATTKTCTLTQDLSETVQIDANGITLNCANHVISGTGGSTGILVFFTNGVTVENCEVQNFGTGIRIDSSISCHVINNFVHNSSTGILLRSSAGSMLIDNFVSDGFFGIILFFRNSSTTMIGNTMTNNTANFFIKSSLPGGQYENTIDTSNTVDGKPILYVKDQTYTVFDSSTNAGTFYCVRCEHVTVRDLSLTNSGTGVVLVQTNNSTLENLVVSDNWFIGIRITHSAYNTVADSVITDSSFLAGITMFRSSSNILTGNTITNNPAGLRFVLPSCSCDDNLIYNNTFRNSRNVRNSFGSNFWNIAKTPETNIIGGPFLGGNHWSDYLGLDLDGDGIGDTLLPYNKGIANGGDFLPLVLDTDGDGVQDNVDKCPLEDATGLDANLDGCKDTIEDLIEVTQSFNLKEGVSTSLVSILQQAQGALQLANEGSVPSATARLGAFRNLVEAQRGKALTDEQADLLVAMVDNVLAQL